MRPRVLRNGSVSLSRLNPLEVDALLRIPQHADPTDVPEAQNRLYQQPLRGEDAVEAPESEQMHEDWEEIVKPELGELFDESIRHVKEDLSRIRPDRRAAASKTETGLEEELLDDEEADFQFKLTIPKDHVDSWYRAMNQARLVMAEKQLWVEDSGRLHGPLLPSIHYEIYCMLQQWMVENAMR